MSVTGHNAIRNPDDFYATPAWASRSIVRQLGRPASVLEPAMGAGAIGLVLAELWPGLPIHGVDIDGPRAYEATLALSPLADVSIDVEDFLTWTPPRRFDLAITNPPFKLALPFIEKALTCADVVVMLLRMNFAAGVERVRFHGEHPANIRMLARRPSFAAVVRCVAKCGWEIVLPAKAERPKRCLACGGKRVVMTSDSTEYGWFVWGDGRPGRWDVLPLEALPPRPKKLVDGKKKAREQRSLFAGGAE